MVKVLDVRATLERVHAGESPQSLEGQNLDFKEDSSAFKDTAKMMAEAAACFANASGGTLVLGVRNQPGGPDAILGTSLEANRLARQIYELTEPGLTVAAQELDFRGKTLIEVRVPQGQDVHMVNGRATKRRADACIAMSSGDIARLMNDRRGVDWSSVATEIPITAVSPVAMARARELLRQLQDPERTKFAGFNDADLLRALGVATADGHLVRAGVLLFCDKEHQGQMPTELIVYQHRRSPGGEPTLIQRLDGPLLLAFLRVQELVDARLDKTPLSLPDGQQIHLADLPEAAVREAIANAVIHRDYGMPGPVQVEHAPTRLVVTSPGPLVPGVTVDNILTTPSRPRNSALTTAVRMLGLAEQAGVGVERMYREMIRIGHHPPEITEEDPAVRVALLGGSPNKSIAKYVASLPQDCAEDADALLVLFHLLTNRSVTNEAIAPVLQKSEAEAEGVLSALASEEVAMLEVTRETARYKKRTYRLREHVVRQLDTAVTYRRRTIDTIDRKIIETVEELGMITGRAVQLLFDVNASRASRIISDLVEREVLIKTSTQQRGPGVTYGKGPKFPAKRKTRSKKAASQATTSPSIPTDSRSPQDQETSITGTGWHPTLFEDH